MALSPHIRSDQKIREFMNLFNGDLAAATRAIQEYSNSLNAEPRNAATHGNVILSATNVTKNYAHGKQRTAVLRNASLQIYQGEFLVITGASGSGKSTLLQLLGGLDKPTSGHITINNVDINNLSDAKLAALRSQTIGFVFQSFYLQPFLQLGTNVELPGMFARTKRAKRRARAYDLIQKVGLSAQERQLPKELSGGQMQRAAIARALLNNPEILLADEPTGNLDSTNSTAIIDLFLRIRAEFGTTIVVVTHNAQIAAQADRHIQLHDGVII